MLQGLGNVVVLGAFSSAFAVAVVLWRRPWTGLAAAGAITVGSWILLGFVMEADIQHELDLIAARQASGEELSYSDQMYDGVGERVAVLFFGWIFGGAGLVLGVVVAFATRWLRGPRSDT